MGDTITVTTGNLPEWINAGNDPTKLMLALDGRVLKGILAVVLS